MRLSWESRLLSTPTETPSSDVSAAAFTLLPGQSRNVWLPTMQVQQGVVGGETMSLALTMSSGTESWVDRLRLRVASQDVATIVAEDLAVAGVLTAGPAHPNPFNAQTAIPLYLPSPQAVQVSVVVFDLMGQRIRQICNQELVPGPHQLTWDGRDDAGHPAATGTYLCRVMHGAVTSTFSVTLLR
ncbi:MAG: hypothetical protein O2782_19635 [bacterium]|nr:hypothetical protein [bacterium]